VADRIGIAAYRVKGHSVTSLWPSWVAPTQAAKAIQQPPAMLSLVATAKASLDGGMACHVRKASDVPTTLISLIVTV